MAEPSKAAETSKTAEALPWVRIPPWVDAATRFGALIVGALYVVGLLIVNIEMAGYGVFNIGLARAEYILVGTTWALLIGVALSIALVSLGYLPKTIGSKSSGTLKTLATYVNVAWVIVSVLIAPSFTVIGAIFLLSQWVFGLTPAIDNWKTFLLHTAALAVNVVVLFLGYHVFTSPADSDRGAPYDTKERPPVMDVSSLKRWGTFAARGQGLFTVTVFFVLALALYTATVFSLIPQALGGGRRPPVCIVLAESPRIDLKSLGLPAVKEKGCVGPVAMLGETGTMYFVVDAREGRSSGPWRLSGRGARAVGIEKQRVAAIVPLAEPSPDKQSRRTAP